MGFRRRVRIRTTEYVNIRERKTTHRVHGARHRNGKTARRGTEIASEDRYAQQAPRLRRTFVNRRISLSLEGWPSPLTSMQYY